MTRSVAELARLTAAGVATALLTVMPVSAAEPNEGNDWAPMLQMFMEHDISKWAHDAQVLDAVRAQNLTTAGLNGADIARLDELWMDPETGKTLIANATESPLAEFLRMEVEAYYGAVTEIIITDARGLNVAVSQPTSDYWQGDEAKFTETFEKGAGTIYVGEMEVDASTGTYQGQVSMTLTDPVTGAPIGSITVGVVPEML